MWTGFLGLTPRILCNSLATAEHHTQLRLDRIPLMVKFQAGRGIPLDSPERRLDSSQRMYCAKKALRSTSSGPILMTYRFSQIGSRARSTRHSVDSGLLTDKGHEPVLLHWSLVAPALWALIDRLVQRVIVSLLSPPRILFGHSALVGRGSAAHVSPNPRGWLAVG